MANLFELLGKAFTDKRFEPEMRKHGGPLMHHGHRFPIKGGISLREVMVRQITKTNKLFQHFRQDKSDDTS